MAGALACRAAPSASLSPHRARGAGDRTGHERAQGAGGEHGGEVVGGEGGRARCGGAHQCLLRRGDRRPHSSPAQRPRPPPRVKGEGWRGVTGGWRRGQPSHLPFPIPPLTTPGSTRPCTSTRRRPRATGARLRMVSEGEGVGVGVRGRGLRLDAAPSTTARPPTYPGRLPEDAAKPGDRELDRRGRARRIGAPPSPPPSSHPVLSLSTDGARALTYAAVHTVRRTTVRKASKSKRADMGCGLCGGGCGGALCRGARRGRGPRRGLPGAVRATHTPTPTLSPRSLPRKSSRRAFRCPEG